MARWLGVLKLSWRQLQRRWLESALIVLGIGLGVGVLTTGETFVRFQGRMTTDFLVGQIREWEAVTVRPQSMTGLEALFDPDGVPAVRVSMAELEREPVRFSLADVAAMRAVPGVEFVTVQGGGRGWFITELEGVQVEAPASGLDGPPGLGESPASQGAAASGGGGASEGVSMPAPAASSPPPGAVRTVVEVYTPPPSAMHLQAELVTPDEFAVAGHQFVAGVPFTWDDFNGNTGRIVLERRSAERLFPGLTPEEMIGHTITVGGGGPFDAGGRRLFVVGVVEPPEARRAIMDLLAEADGQHRFFAYAPATMGGNGRFVQQPSSGAEASEEEAWRTDQLYLSPAEERVIPDVLAEAQVYFEQKYGPGRVELRNPLAERQDTLEELTGVVVALLVLAGLGLVIAAVNVLNLFTARVLRRVRITGMSVALGATRRLLFWQTAGEALLLGAAGSALGVGLAGGFVTVIRTAMSAQILGEPGILSDPFAAFRVGVADVGVGMLAGVGMSLVFGLYPAWLGARQHPAEALRVE